MVTTSPQAPPKAAGRNLAGMLCVFYLYAINIPNAVAIGPTSLAGVISIAIAGVALFLAPWLISVREKRYRESDTWTRWLPVAWWLFMLWCFVSLARAFTIGGAQNVTVWISFTFALAVAALTTTSESLRWLLDNVRRAAWIMSLAYLALVAVHGPGTNVIIGARSYAYTALFLLCIMVAAPLKTKGNFVLPAFLVLMIGLSLSRTALAIALLLLVASIIRGKRGSRAIRATLMIGIAGAVAWQVVMRYEPLYNRFFEGDDAFVVGDLKLNTSGRMAFWERLWESASVDPWFGRGIGSSVTVTSRYYAEFGTDQPHNDYLRLFHDLGYIGVTLFVVTWIALIVGAARRAARSIDSTTKQVHIAAALALAMVAIAAITDNMIIYPFIMVPVGVLVGASIANVRPSSPVEH